MNSGKFQCKISGKNWLYISINTNILSLQYRSKVLVHFPRYCGGGITVCISGLTSAKPRLTSLKTPVLPWFFCGQKYRNKE